MATHGQAWLKEHVARQGEPGLDYPLLAAGHVRMRHGVETREGLLLVTGYAGYLCKQYVLHLSCHVSLRK